MNTNRRYLLLILGILFFFLTAWILIRHTSHSSIQIDVESLQHIMSKNAMSLPNRIEYVSRHFLNKPYEANALGEGAFATYDQGLLYRLDAFDCETYVDTVLAIALSSDFEGFKQTIQHIRYQNGHVSFTTRNHFASLDWNLNNQKNGILQDITETMVDAQNQPISRIAVAVIDKPHWYAKLPATRIRLPKASSEEQKNILTALHAEGLKMNVATAAIPYIPLTALFDKKGRPQQKLFRQIPHAAVVEIVRPNWNLTNEIGTHLNVSHMGWVFWKNGELRFRHAAMHQKVQEVSFIHYLKKALKSPTIRGINIQIVIEK